MKSKHIFVGSALLLVLFMGIVWWQKSAQRPNTATEAKVSLPSGAVEQPMLAPVPPVDKTRPAAQAIVTNGADANALAANQQATLDGLLKFQSELEQSLAASTDPQEREALQQELDHLQTQIQFEINASTVRPVVASNLGEIALVDKLPLQRKLASGDVATFTATTTTEGTWSVNVIVRHTDKGGATSDESTSVVLQPGQAADIKVTGNEIHFTPRAASALSK